MPTPLNYEKWAYVWAANQYFNPLKSIQDNIRHGTTDDTMGVGEGFIETNKLYCDVYDGVLWDHRSTAYKYRDKPVIGYIYEANFEKTFTHKAEILKILHIDDLDPYLQFLPPWRYQCYSGVWEGKPPLEHKKTDRWFVITKIGRLETPLHPTQFEIFKKGISYKQPYKYGTRKVVDTGLITVDGW